jgi:mRNA interferase RelE/StbE
MTEKQENKRYRITIAPSAIKTLGTLENTLRTRIQKRIEELADTLRHRQSKKLKGDENLYRNRVGVYRIVYTIQDDKLIVLVLAIGHRREIYDRD